MTSLKVAVERIKEFSEIKREPPEFVEPRPPASWPSSGAINCEDLVIRYAVRNFLKDKLCFLLNYSLHLI